ncbi:MAG: tetratricopeptide repeat protein [Acidobacteria bacterium]|nr:tetratricopeptide repeat protein [Acidobacteriota bacterium]
MPRFAPAALLIVLLPFLCRAQSTVALPLINSSGDTSVEWLGEAVSENILDAVHAAGLVAIDRNDRAGAMDRLGLPSNIVLTRASVLRVADELDATHAAFGKFEVQNTPGSKAQLVLTARVIDRKYLRQSPEIVERGLLEDLAVLQDRLAWRVLNTVSPNAAGTEPEFLERRARVRVDAIENFIRGLQSKDTLARHRHFTQAARLDPSYSQPCFQLGLHYWDNEDYQQAARWFERVGRADAHYFEAMYYQAISRHYLGEYGSAEHLFLTVLSHVPLNEVFCNLGASQLRQAKWDAAISNFEKALEGDPADPDYHFDLAYALWHAKRFDDAAAEFRAVLERIPDDKDATALLGLCLRNQGPKSGDPKYEGLERMKEDYEETVFRQLKALIEKK